MTRCVRQRLFCPSVFTISRLDAAFMSRREEATSQRPSFCPKRLTRIAKRGFLKSCGADCVWCVNVRKVTASSSLHADVSSSLAVVEVTCQCTVALFHFWIFRWFILNFHRASLKRWMETYWFITDWLKENEWSFFLSFNIQSEDLPLL